MQAWILLLALVAAAPAAAQPVTYAWRLDCTASAAFGPFGTPDACTAARNTIGRICNAPTLIDEAGKTVPNPQFVHLSDVCGAALNGRGCECVYTSYVAQPATGVPPGHRTLGDLVRERQRQLQQPQAP